MRTAQLAALGSAALVVFAWVGCGGGGDTGGSAGAGGNATSQGSGAHHPSSSNGASSGGGGAGAGGGVPQCAKESWSTYGHDGQRTFASDGCISGPLTAAWHYVPAPPSGRTFNFVSHAIASQDAAYLQWSASDMGYIGTTALDKLSTAGQRLWTYDTGTDSNLGNWATLAWGFAILNDNGVYFLKDADGTLDGTNGVDWWGQTIADDKRLYLVNNEHVDGPGIFVGALDKTRMTVWQTNQFGNCRIDAGDAEGGLALDGGVLFYAPSYSFGMGPTASFSSGVYAFDAAKGTPKWTQPTSPLSPLSAQGGQLFLIETGSGAMPAALVARSQKDGTVAWQQPFTSAGAQAPVLAGGLVIVTHDFTTISAYDQKTGKKQWDAMVANAQSFSTPLTFSGGCNNDSVPTVMNPRTTIAAALASQTLVVTGSDVIHVLKLTNGKEQWSGAPATTMAPYRDPVIVGETVYVMNQTGLAQLESK